MITLILAILALICFIIATFGLSARINFTAAGLAILVLAYLLQGVTIGPR